MSDSAISIQTFKTQALVDLGVTATASELNTLDGITSTVTELNYTDGVTSAIQPQINSVRGKTLAILSGV